MWFKKYSPLVFLMALFFMQSANATYLSILIGPKNETYTQTNQSQRSRLNPMSLFLEMGIKLKSKWYLSLGASGEFDLSTQATTGFTLALFTKYFILGSPDRIKTEGKDARLSLVLPYTLFVGGGIFQKNIKFADDPNLINVDTSLGGLGILFGGSYNLSERYYLISQFQYLTSGSSTDKSYTSMEFYAGMGLRF